jgi:exosortase
MNEMIGSTRAQRATNAALPFLLPAMVAVGLIFALYWGTFLWWWSEWTAAGSFYAHAMFVPFFVAVMIWRNRERLAQTEWRPSWLGLPLICMAMALLLLAQRSDVTTVKSLSFIFLLLGATLLLAGVQRTRVLLFPLLFVIMMMPLIPDQLINGIAFPIQMMSATIATKMLNLMTLNSVQQGVMIQMDSYRMAVELPCSGFKTLISLMTFSAAFAYLVQAALWKRWFLFLMTIPLSLIINSLRITFIGIAGELISAKAATTFHDWSGFIVLILAFMILFNVARLIRCEHFLGIPLDDDAPAAKSEEKKAIAGEGDTAEAQAAPTTPQAPPWWQIALTSIQEWRPQPAQLHRLLPFMIAINLCLILTLAVRSSAIKKAAPKPPIGTAQVPRSVTHNGTTFVAQEGKDFDKLAPEVQEVLKPLRAINRNYNSADGAFLHLFITAGNGRRVFHDPQTCIQGSNGQLVGQVVTDIPTQHGTLRVQEARVKQMGRTEDTLMFFFYVVESKIVQRTDQVRNAMIWQTLLGDSGKPSYFVRVTQNMPGTDEQKRQQAIRFITGLWNEIGPILMGEKEAVEEPPPAPAK